MKRIARWAAACVAAGALGVSVAGTATAATPSSISAPAVTRPAEAGVPNAAGCAAVKIPAGARKTTGQYATLTEKGWSTYDFNDMFDPQGPQTLWSLSPSHFGALSKQALRPWPPGTDVYPDLVVPIGKMDNNRRANAFKTLTTSVSESMPHNGLANASYDVWMNGTGIEMMVWNETYGTFFSNYANYRGIVSVNGVRYKAYTLSKSGHSTAVWYVRTSNVASQTISIKAFLQYTEDAGWIVSNPILSSIDYGWEIFSTAGCTQAFTVNKFSLTNS